MTVDEHRMDGNVVGGLLGEAFTFEMTDSVCACDRCGAVAHVGEQMAYVSEIGTVVRCASCDNALIRIVQNPKGYFLDMRGMSYLRFGS